MRPMPDKLIRAAAADRVGHGAGGAAELGADARALQVHFGDVELVDLGAQIAEPRVGDVRAVDQIGVVLAAAAGGRADRAAVVGDAGNQLKQARGTVRSSGRLLSVSVLKLKLTSVDRTSTIGWMRRDGQRFRDGQAEDDVDLGALPTSTTAVRRALPTPALSIWIVYSPGIRYSN